MLCYYFEEQYFWGERKGIYENKSNLSTIVAVGHKR